MTPAVRFHESVRADIHRLRQVLGEEAAARAVHEARETVAAFLAQTPGAAGTFVVESSPTVRTYFVVRPQTATAVVVQLESLPPVRIATAAQ